MYIHSIGYIEEYNMSKIINGIKKYNAEEQKDNEESLQYSSQAFYDRCIYCELNGCSDCAPGWNN